MSVETTLMRRACCSRRETIARGTGRQGAGLWCAGLLGLVLGVVSGCGGSPTSPDGAPNGSTAKPPTEAELPPLKGEVTLEPATWDDLQKTVASHKGKVVVVDVWSSWCEPCVRELPGLVKLQRRHQDKVVCLSFNLNYDGIDPEPNDEQKDAALKTLKELGAKLPNYLSTVPDEKVFQLADVTLPSVLVYGKDGALAKKFAEDPAQYGNKGFTYEKHIEPYVKSLIEAKAP